MRNVYIILSIELSHSLIYTYYLVFSRLNAKFFLESTSKDGSYDENVSAVQKKLNIQYLTTVNVIVMFLSFGGLPAIFLSIFSAFGDLVPVFSFNTSSGIKWIFSLTALNNIVVFCILSIIEYYCHQREVIKQNTG